MNPEPTKAVLLTLLEECPVHGDNPADCPLYHIRQETPESKREWVDSMTDEEFQGILDFHGNCMSRRLEEERETARKERLARKPIPIRN